MKKAIEVNGQVFELGYCEKTKALMLPSSCERMRKKCQRLALLPEWLRYVVLEDLLIADLPCLFCKHPITS